MFDSATTDAFQSQLADAHAVTYRERDWIVLHEEILSVGRQIVCLEAREIDLLLEAEETKLYRRIGFPTAIRVTAPDHLVFDLPEAASSHEAHP